MSWIAVGSAAITVIGGAVSANQANKGAKNAAQAQVQASQMQVDEQRRQYDQTRQDMMPWMDTGKWGLGEQQRLMQGDMSGFHQSPDYAYARDQMVKGMDRSAAARGRLYSGGYGVDMAAQLNGLASQNYNNHWNRLAGLSGTGQNTAGQLGQFGANAAGQIGNAYGQMGQARGSAYQQIGQNNAQLTAGIAGAASGLWGQYMGQRRQPQGDWYHGNNGWS